LGLAGCDLGVGIGIHAGELSFGEFGWSHCDLNAIGTVINTTSLGSLRRRRPGSCHPLRGLIALSIVEYAPHGEPFHCQCRLNGKYGKNGP
jgi:class 3 adenylate cyclase